MPASPRRRREFIMKPPQLADGPWSINDGPLSCSHQLSSHPAIQPSSINHLLPRLLLSLLLFLFSIAPLPTQAQPVDTPADPGQAGQAVPHQILPPIDEDLCPGEIFPFRLTIYLPRTPAKGDIIFAFDSTGSMGGVIYAAQMNAMNIMDDLNHLISDVRFGVVDIEDYPLDPYGVPGVNEPYRLRQPLTDDRNTVRLAIEALSANQGGDLPEAYTRAIYESHADARIGWRDDARRLLLMFGDSVPHDDDLNESLPYPQPYKPGRRWETGFPPSFLDPGRDGDPGTPDDLDFQTELTALVNQDIALLSVVTSSTFPQPSHGELVIYWNAWATPTGGKAVPLWNAGDLPELIRDLVEDTIVGVIKRLALRTEPDLYASWVYSDPAEITDIPIPSDGEYSFLGKVEAPANAEAGTYQFRILAVGDGIVYGEKPVTITVPEECFLPIDPPTWYYLPLIAKERVEPMSKEPVR